MSIKIMSLIFDIKDQLSPTEKLILLSLADHGNDRGEGIWPGSEKIQERTGLGETAVRETLKLLTTATILITVKAATPNSSTERKINVQLLEELLAAGEKGVMHPALPKARRIVEEEKALRKSLKEQAAPDDPPSRNEVPPAPGVVGEGRETRYPPRQTDQGGSPNGPESLINHPLTINQSEGNLGEKDCSFSLTDLWEMVKGQLQGQMKHGDFESYVKPLRPISSSNGVLRLRIPNPYARDWVDQRLGKTITRTASSIAGREMIVLIEADSTDVYANRST